MLTAKGFLRNRDYDTLDELIMSDPDRLRLEFLEIATDVGEPCEYRLTSLRILWSHAHTLGTINSLCVTHGLIAAFEREFPPKTLNNLANLVRISQYPNCSLLVDYFCIAMATVAGDRAQGPIDAVRQVFKGTWREAALDARLEAIKRRRDGLGSES
jgi:hypothetical protein